MWTTPRLVALSGSDIAAEHPNVDDALSATDEDPVDGDTMATPRPITPP